DPLKASATSKVPEVQEWLQQIMWVQEFLAKVLQVAQPSLHDACRQTISAMESTLDLQDAASRWPAIFEVIELIVNCVTPWHHDAGGFPEAYDFLLNLGNCQDARFDIADCQTSLSYPPGSIIYLTGKVLMHSVKDWGKGWERAVITHFTKDAVHDRLGVACP
ncbi:hypothetical protein PAXRUDRAFT_71913, partial [Paxillus rubicundulus Ve08.2h10]